MWAVWGYLRPHKIEQGWHVHRRRWVCMVCARRVRFRGGVVPFHRYWWRWWG